MKAPPKQCFVCWRDGGKPVQLPNGATADLCKECASDSFMVAEGVRRSCVLALVRGLEALS